MHRDQFGADYFSEQGTQHQALRPLEGPDGQQSFLDGSSSRIEEPERLRSGI